MTVVLFLFFIGILCILVYMLFIIINDIWQDRKSKKRVIEEAEEKEIIKKAEEKEIMLLNTRQSTGIELSPEEAEALKKGGYTFTGTYNGHGQPIVRDSAGKETSYCRAYINGFPSLCCNTIEPKKKINNPFTLVTQEVTD